MKFFETRYRIVRDRWAGYEVQVWRWWWPMWCCVGSNTHCSLSRAREYANCLKNPFAEYL